MKQVIAVVSIVVTLTCLGFPAQAQTNGDRDSFGRTPLMRALVKDPVVYPYPYAYAYAGALIKQGADINASDNEGKTVLMYAIETHATWLVKQVLKYGADATRADKAGRTPLMYAAMSSRQQIVSSFQSQSVNEVLMERPIVKLLLDYGADVNARDNGGRTALMYAAEKENMPVFDLLLVSNADVTICDNAGKTVRSYVRGRRSKNFIRRIDEAEAAQEAKVKQTIIDTVKQSLSK